MSLLSGEADITTQARGNLSLHQCPPIFKHLNLHTFLNYAGAESPTNNSGASTVNKQGDVIERREAA